MKKKMILGIMVVLIVILLVICGIIFLGDHNEESNEQLPINMSNSENSIVTIKNSEIQNEDLIDEFLDSSNNDKNCDLEIDVTLEDDTTKIKIEHIPGETSDNGGKVTVISQNATAEDYQNYYGYYKYIVNEEEKGRYDNARWRIKRNVNENNEVQLIFASDLLDVAENPVICKYNLESSAYEKKYELIYSQRKDMGVKQIATSYQYDNTDFGVYTFGGDVTITIENDMVYTLSDALEQKVITIQDILDQMKQDEKYGICDVAYYSDGGSKEYRYSKYTILKYNTLDGNNDLIIGMQGEIINLLNKIKYKK